MNKEEQLILELINNVSFLEISDRAKIDWKRLSDILIEKRIFIFLYPHISDYIPEEYKDGLETKYDLLKQEIDRHIKEIENIQKGFMKEGINAVFIKGLFLSQIAYKSLYARQYNDIDIVVEKEDMLRAYRVVYEQGYKFCPGFDRVSGEPILLDTPEFLFRDDHHEYPCRKKDEDGNRIKLEVKYATSAIPYKNIRDFINHYQVIKINQAEIKTLDNNYTLLHIIAHLYENVQGEDNIYGSERYLKDFTDLKMFLNQHSDIDWEYLYDKAEKLEIVHQIYFSLYSLNALWKNTIETEILDLFNPRNITYIYEGNEYGERYTWKNDIITRCFNREERLKEYCHLYKTELFDRTDIPLIKNDGNIHTFIIEKGDVESNIFVSIDRMNKCIRLIMLFDSEMFSKEDLYFYLTLVDNDMSKDMINRNICATKEVFYTNLEGEWKTYHYKMQGISFVDIKTDDIFSAACNKIYMLVDIYKNIGDVGFRGTGAKCEFILCNTIEDERTFKF